MGGCRLGVVVDVVAICLLGLLSVPLSIEGWINSVGLIILVILLGLSFVFVWVFEQTHVEVTSTFVLFKWRGRVLASFDHDEWLVQPKIIVQRLNFLPLYTHRYLVFSSSKEAKTMVCYYLSKQSFNDLYATIMQYHTTK